MPGMLAVFVKNQYIVVNRCRERKLHGHSYTEQKSHFIRDPAHQ